MQFERMFELKGRKFFDFFLNFVVFWSRAIYLEKGHCEILQSKTVFHKHA